MKDLKPNSIRGPRRNSSHKHPWMGLLVPVAKTSVVRELLPVICRPIEERAIGPRGV